MSYPQVKVGKQVRRADGVLMEEVITTTREGNRLVETRNYRVVGSKVDSKPAAADPDDLAALLGEDDDEPQPSSRPVRSANPSRAAKGPGPRPAPAQEAPAPLSDEDGEGSGGARAPAAPAASAGPGTPMEKLTLLKQCFDEGILSKEEYDVKRKQVLDEMMSGGGAQQQSQKAANPSRQQHGPREDSPEAERKTATADDRRYIQNRYAHVYQNASDGPARDKSAVMGMQPTGVDGVYFTGRDPVVVDTIEETLPDRKDGPEHKFRIIKTTVKKELLDTGVVRVTRIEKFYDGYSGQYLTMNKSEKMKPKLAFHTTEEWDQDEEFEMREGTMKTGQDDVKTWTPEFQKDDEDEYNRVMTGAIGDKQYVTRNVNNAAGKGDFGWDGVYRYADGKPEQPVKREKKGFFGGKKKPAKDPNDKWAGFEDDWGDGPSADQTIKGDHRMKGEKPGYKDGGRKGIFQVKKAQPKPGGAAKDKNMGEDPNAYKLDAPKSDAHGEHLKLGEKSAGGFMSGEMWGAGAKQHTGKHEAGGSHFQIGSRGDMWK